MTEQPSSPLDTATVPTRSPRSSSVWRTFVIADIRGYTSFTQQFGDEKAAELVVRFAAVTREVVEQDGTVLELRGDEALCVFDSPRQALRSAVALMRRYVEETQRDPASPLPVGIGIDVGEAVAVQGGYRGGALNLAARLCSSAAPGEILATAETVHLARHVEGLSYVPRDAVQVAGIADPVRVVRVVPDDDDPARQFASLPRSPPETLRATGPRRLLRVLRRRRVLAVGAAAVATAVVATTLVVVIGGRNPLTSLSENVAGILDPRTGALAGQVGVGANPTAVAVGAGAVWVVNTDDDSVSRIDPASRRVVQTTPVEGAPTSVAVGGGFVWVSNSTAGTVSRIDPGTGHVRDTFPVGAAPAALAYYRGALWVADTTAAELLRVDPAKDAVTARVSVGTAPSAVVAGDGHVWVSNSGDGTVSEVDPLRATPLQPVRVGNDPRGMALDGGSLWVANNLDGTVMRIATATATVGPSVSLGSGSGRVGVAVASGRVWVADQDGAAISEIDPRSNTPLRSVPTGSQPAGIVAAGNSVWVAVGGQPGLHRGGTFSALITDVTADPYYSDGPSLPVQRMMYDGLLAMRQAPGAAGDVVVPDLATALPTRSDDGLSYTFRLRRDIRWSTGARVTGDDILRGIERAVAAGALELPIVGADACTAAGTAATTAAAAATDAAAAATAPAATAAAAAGAATAATTAATTAAAAAAACDLSSGVSVDDATGTLTITLTKPAPEFKFALAGTVAFPASTPLLAVDSPPPVTGPYEVASYREGTSLVLVRNTYFHEWSHAAQPAGFPDRFVFTMDPTWSEHPDAESQRSGFDWMDVRGADLEALQARVGPRLRRSPRNLGARYVFLNASVPPFNSREARQAVDYALDRRAVAAAWTGPTTPMCQLLPPFVPGYRPYCPYTLRPDPSGTWNGPDVVTAQHLVQESGTAGASVRVLTRLFFKGAMQPVVDAMNEIGYSAKLVVVPTPTYFDYLDQHPDAQAGEMGWGGYPAAFAFATLATCARVGGGQNYARFCDPAVDAKIDSALSLEARSQQAASDAWAQVDQALTDEAPYLPVFIERNAVLLSPRVGHYEVSAPSGPIFDEAWLR